MLYPLAWLPAEVPPSFGANADDASPAVTQSQTNRKKSTQRLRPGRGFQPPTVNHRPALSRPTSVAQRPVAEEGVENADALKPDSKDILLKYGHRGQAVKVLQTHLQGLGQYSGAVDGIFGPLTEAGVRAFQQQQALPVDGVVGPLTWQRLISRVDPEASAPVPSKTRPFPQFSTSRLRQPQPTSTVTAPSATLDSSQPPVFPPALIPDLAFHRLDAPFSQGQTKAIWVTALTVVAVGGVAFYFKPDNASGPRKLNHQRSRRNSSTIHHPQPVYSKTRRPGQPQKVHSPVPVYPAGSSAPAHPEQAVSISPPASPPPLPQANQLSNDSPDQEHQRQVEAALHQLAQQVPWAEQGFASYLSDFLYDLQMADSRQQLEGVVAVMPPPQASKEHTERPTKSSKASPTKRLGTFPEHHHRTKTPYTYLLLNDLGGCFCLIKNELWLTETAMTWLNDEEPYTLTIRRFDGNGRTVDKRFTVTLSSHQVQMAS